MLRVQHALSTRNATYLTRVTIAKTVMITLAIFFISVPLLLPIVFVLCGVGMLVSGSLEPPVSSRVANRFRVRLDIALCWMFMCGLVSNAVSFSDGVPARDSTADYVLTYLPAGALLPFLHGWLVYVVGGFCSRQRAASRNRVAPAPRGAG